MSITHGHYLQPAAFMSHDMNVIPSLNHPVRWMVSGWLILADADLL
jgi:hypothetical protein